MIQKCSGHFRGWIEEGGGRGHWQWEVRERRQEEKHLKYRQPQANYNIFGQPISQEESFIQDCNAVIAAISKSMLEDKVKDELKKQLSPNFQSLIEIVEFYKNIIKN